MTRHPDGIHRGLLPDGTEVTMDTRGWRRKVYARLPDCRFAELEAPPPPVPDVLEVEVDDPERVAP